MSHDEFDGSIEIGVRIPVTQRETVMKEREGDFDDMHRRSLGRTNEYTLNLKRRVKGDLEEVATLLYRVISDPDEVASELVPDDIRESDEYDLDALRTEETKLEVRFTGREPVLLAARKRAATLTRESMTRTGTSVEQVLAGWMNIDTEELGRYVTVESIDDLSRAAHAVLFCQFIDHTPGTDEIDASDVPDPYDWGDERPEYDDMHPDRGHEAEA